MLFEIPVSPVDKTVLLLMCQVAYMNISYTSVRAFSYSFRTAVGSSPATSGLLVGAF